MKMTRKLLSVLLALLLVLPFAVSVFADETAAVTEAPATDTGDKIPLSTEPPALTGIASAYLYNFENEVELYQYNTEKVLFPASTVKLMTGILAVEALGAKPDLKITVTAEMLRKATGNNIGLVDGEIVTVRDMLYACLMGGANDAACVLAHAVVDLGEPVATDDPEQTAMEKFVARMNTKASLLGAMKTKYTNPTGIHDDKMVTTVADTAAIAKYAYSLPLLREIVAAAKYVMEETNLSSFRNIYSRNCLISKYYDTYDVPYRYEGATGMNAGGTTVAGSCLVATAENADGDLTYLTVVMGANYDNEKNYAYEAAHALFDWAFSAWRYFDVLSPDTLICETPVRLSSVVDHVSLVPKDSLRVYLPSETDIEKEIEYGYSLYHDALNAPVKKDSLAGIVSVSYKGVTIGSSDLVTTVDIERSEFLNILDQIETFTKSPTFIVIIVTAIILTVAYVLVSARIRAKTKNRYR